MSQFGDFMTNEELVICIQNGSKEYLQLLWTQVEKYIKLWANKYAFGTYSGQCLALGVTADDLYQVGYFAVINAIETYKPDAGKTFLSWLTFYIQNWFNTTLKINKQAGKYYGQSDALLHSCSLDQKSANNDTDLDIKDFIPDRLAEQAFVQVEDSMYQAQVRRDLVEAIDQLPGTYAKIISAYYFDGVRIQSLASTLNLSRVRVDAIRRSALLKLSRAKSLAHYKEKYFTRSTHLTSFSNWQNTHCSQQEHYILDLDDYERTITQKS